MHILPKIFIWGEKCTRNYLGWWIKKIRSVKVKWKFETRNSSYDNSMKVNFDFSNWAVYGIACYTFGIVFMGMSDNKM